MSLEHRTDVDRLVEAGSRPVVERYVVARSADVPPGSRLIVEVAGRQVGIFNIDGEYHAVLNRCPHLGGPLCEGPIKSLLEADVPGELRSDPSQLFLTCPWHGWEFDLRTGRSYLDPERWRARRFPVAVEGGGVAEVGGRVSGRFRAEVVPVSLEEERLVVTMRAAPI
jgi:nitrite reductase/ring-hydroxylating ferredoxin subunit